MTRVNVAEVAYLVEQRWGKARVHQVLAALETTAVETRDVKRDLALLAARSKLDMRYHMPMPFPQLSPYKRMVCS